MLIENLSQLAMMIFHTMPFVNNHESPMYLNKRYAIKVFKEKSYQVTLAKTPLSLMTYSYVVKSTLNFVSRI